jgi:hypothetical protein
MPNLRPDHRHRPAAPFLCVHRIGVTMDWSNQLIHGPAPACHIAARSRQSVRKLHGAYL